MPHIWSFLSEDAQSATYHCSALCGQKVSFPKEGFGEPTAYPPKVPEGIDKYTGECQLPVYDPARIVSKRNFLDRLTVPELSAILSGEKDHVEIQVLMFKFEQTTEVPLDHPDTRATLEYFVSLGYLQSNRVDAILT